MLRKSIIRAITFSQKGSLRFSRYYGNRIQYQLDVDQIRTHDPIYSFIDYYREHAHHFIDFDPLKLNKNINEFPLATNFNLKYTDDIKESLSKDPSSYLKLLNLSSVDQLEGHLRNIYMNTVGVEFEHVSDLKEKNWLYYNLEKHIVSKLTTSERLNIHNLLISTEAFDHFLLKKFPTFKRYALEGNESMIIALRTMFAKSSELGVTDVILGMPHRGRLNTLVNIMDYPSRDLFQKMQGKADIPASFYNRVDDVVSHIACSNKKIFKTGSSIKEKEISVSLLNNPSHLEGVNAVSMGKTRAKQDDYNSFEKVLNVQLHGDAAHSGQGVVYETITLGKVPKYDIHGTIHMVVNNQIGYTTTPIDGRTSKYCTEISKAFEMPIIHVNSDDVEAVHKISNLAAEYRQTFHKDIMIDLIGYRRYGHNEVDEPEFTQPLMYNHIRKAQPTGPKLYHEKLTKKNLVKVEDYDKTRQKVWNFLENEFKATQTLQRSFETYKNDNNKGTKAFTDKWRNMVLSSFGSQKPTGLNKELLKEYGKNSVLIPQGFTVHPRIDKFHIKERINQLDSELIDWPTAEAISFISLLDEGYNVRISGQDVERGTFSQRHCVLLDQKTEKEWNPIKDWAERMNKGRFQAYNSPLSEYGTMGYEYGYSIENPSNLVIWEAQFGDFFNGAQIVIDTFITGSEEKWLRQNGLVLLLPHGFDGAGPEHSTCRMERFLQAANSDGLNRGFQYKEHVKDRKELKVEDQVFYENHNDANFSLVVPTTPANFFHVLRRQMMRNYRKPLIVASAKTLLRHPEAKSNLSDMAEGTEFKPVLAYSQSHMDKKKTVVFCSGKVSYEIQAFLEKNPQTKENTLLLVIEELFPFPEVLIKSLLNGINKSAQSVWVQEEPLNSGGYSFVEPRLYRILKGLGLNYEIKYCGRRSLACPAIGYGEGHKRETKEITDYLENLCN